MRNRIVITEDTLDRILTIWILIASLWCTVVLVLYGQGAYPIGLNLLAEYLSQLPWMLQLAIVMLYALVTGLVLVGCGFQWTCSLLWENWEKRLRDL